MESEPFRSQTERASLEPDDRSSSVDIDMQRVWIGGETRHGHDLAGEHQQGLRPGSRGTSWTGNV